MTSGTKKIFQNESQQQLQQPDPSRVKNRITMNKYWKEDKHSDEDDEEVESDILNIIQKKPTKKEKRGVIIQEEDSQLEDDLLNIMEKKPTKKELRQQALQVEEKKRAQNLALKKALEGSDYVIENAIKYESQSTLERNKAIEHRNQNLIRAIHKFPQDEKDESNYFSNRTAIRRSPSPTLTQDRNYIRDLDPVSADRLYQKKKLQLTDNNYTPISSVGSNSAKHSQVTTSRHSTVLHNQTNDMKPDMVNGSLRSSNNFSSPYYVTQSKYNFNPNGTYNPALASIFKMSALTHLSSGYSYEK